MSSALWMSLREAQLMCSLCRYHTHCAQTIVATRRVHMSAARWAKNAQNFRSAHRTSKHIKNRAKLTTVEGTDTSQSKTSLTVELLMKDANPAVEDHGKDPFEDRLKELERLNMLMKEDVEQQLSSVADDEDDDDFEVVVSNPQVPTSSQTYLEEISLDRPQRHTEKLPLSDGSLDQSNDLDLVSETPCPGCGAKLHCRVPGTPGYITKKKFMAVPPEELRDQFCHRCHLMRDHSHALNVSVPAEEYVRIISGMRDVHALTVLIVDVMDIPNSLFPGLPQLIGRKRPIYVIGNKVDLVPKDQEGYLGRLQEALEQVCRDEGLSRDMYVHYVGLISAKTGYGVEELVTRLFDHWSNRGHVYILGCTNVGKSTLFNALLSSDYCKAGARDFIHRATTSVWPGTTLSLLQFPIMSAVGKYLYQRVKRLQAEKKEAIQEAKLKKKMKESKKYISVKGNINQTFLGKRDEKISRHSDLLHGYDGATYSFNPKTESVEESGHSQDALWGEVVGERGVYDEDKHEISRWCYDTPGVINPKQVINLLHQEELSSVLSKTLVKPRIFLIKPSQVMFVSGLGRLDYLEGESYAFLTVIAACTVPVHIVDGKVAEDFYRENVGTAVMGVPLRDREGLWKIPSLVSQEMDIMGAGLGLSETDIMLSSIGWVAVTGSHGMTMKFRAYTPGGAGCGVRSPGMLRYVISLRGKRIPGTQSYKLKPPK